MTPRVADDVPPVIDVRGLARRYGERVALASVTFTVRPGELVAVLGPSGAGKTTLFRCLTRLVEPDAGELVVLGRPLHSLGRRELRDARREIGLIFQQFNLIRRMSAIDNVLAGRLGYVSTLRAVLRRFSRADRQLALASIDRVGLLEHAYQRADSLSGGQQQRVAIARVLAQQSRLILADEPVASLDPDASRDVLSMLREIAHERAIAVLCSLHQVELAADFADRVIGLRDGRIVANVPADELDRAVIYGSFEPAFAIAPHGSPGPAELREDRPCRSRGEHRDRSGIRKIRLGGASRRVAE